MNPTDASGNILNEKDYIGVHIESAVLKGIITSIKEASVLMAKGNEMRSGFVTINVPITIPFHPQNPTLKDVFKLVKPPGFDGKPQA